MNGVDFDINDGGKKPFWKKKWLWAVVAMAAVIVVVVFVRHGGGEPERTTETVALSTLIKTVEVTGELQPLEDASLAFETSGIVERTFADVGDEVRAGEVLMILRGGDTLTSVAAAQKAFEATRARLNQFLAGASEESVSELQAALAAADVRLATARIDVQTARDNDALNVQAGYDELVQAAQSAMIEVRDALAEADAVLGLEHTIANDTFEDELAVNDPQTLADARAAYVLAKESRNQFEAPVFALRGTDDAMTIETYAMHTDDTLLAVEDALRTTRLVLDATRTNSEALSVADIATLRAAVTTARASVQTEREALLAKRQAVQSTRVSAVVALAEQTVALRKAEQDQAQARLDATVRAPRHIDRAVYEADTDKAFADVQTAQARLEQLELRAPFDGIVTDRVADIGESVAAFSKVMDVQALGDAFYVRALVPESDVADVALQDTAVVTFDAFGDDVEFTSRVSHIDPAARDVEGVVFYEIEVQLLDGPSLTLLSGMTADITIESERLEEVITVPQRALTYVDGVPHVRVLFGETVGERPVVLGVRGDGGRVQIVDGLVVGDTIVTKQAP